MPDEQGIISHNGYYMDFIGEIRTSGVESASDKIEYLASLYPENKVFYSVIPSKSYFINDSLKTPFDYEKMLGIMSSKIKSAEYIDAFNTLSLTDYYITDPHFKQDKISAFINELSKKLGINVDIDKNNKIKVEGFIGQHKSKVPDIKGEDIFYLTNPSTDSSVVTNIMGDPGTMVYNTEKLNSASPYDLFLSGPSPISVIKNPNGPEGKRLVIFNDSYSCTVAPLLIEAYSEITLIDLRYVISTLIPSYVEIGNADILFLYNEQIINNGEMLKVIKK